MKKKLIRPKEQILFKEMLSNWSGNTAGEKGKQDMPQVFEILEEHDEVNPDTFPQGSETDQEPPSLLPHGNLTRNKADQFLSSGN